MVSSDINRRYGAARRRRLLFAVFTAAVVVFPHASDAKRSKTGVPASPCSEPDAFVRREIAKIRELQRPYQTQSTGAPKTVAEFFASIEGARDVDPATKTEIAELRRQAEGFNALLKAQGCKTVDIDQELKKDASAPGETAERK